MKKILRSAAIISVLAVMLTGCGDSGNSRVVNVYASTANSAPLAGDRAQSEVNENAEIAPTLPEQAASLEPTELLEPSTLPEPTAFSEPPLITDDVDAPRDFIPDEAYDVDDALRGIIDKALTVEILNEKIAEFNEEYPNYAVSGAEVTDDGEPVTSGLLKNGMSVRLLYDGGGYVAYAVIRAPKDIIPDDADEAYDADDALRGIIDKALTVEILNEKIADFNEEYPNYAVSGAEVTDDGEPVTSGLLKNGMSVRLLYDGGGYVAYAVIRAPRDIIPDEARPPFKYEAIRELDKIPLPLYNIK